MQLNAHETKMVVEMIMIETKEKVQEMSKEEFIHKAESILENKIYQSSPFCPFCLRVFDRIRERNNHVKMIHEKLSIGKFNCGQCEKSCMSESALRFHMKSLRTIDVGKNYKCNLCEKSFKHKSQYPPPPPSPNACCIYRCGWGVQGPRPK